MLGSSLFKFLGVLVAAYVIGFLIFATSLPQTPKTMKRADGIVALTGGGARLDAAESLLESGFGKRLLVSGVNAGTTKNDLHQLAHAGPRFDCCADLGFVAANTRGNAAETAACTAIAVSSWSRRTIICAEASTNSARTCPAYGSSLIP
jgi:hypothetical protein